MLPFGVTIQATVPQRSEIPEGLMNYPVYSQSLSQKLQVVSLLHNLLVRVQRRIFWFE